MHDSFCLIAEHIAYLFPLSSYGRFTVRQKKKKKNCLVVLHPLPVIFENWKNVFTVQKYTAPNFQYSIFFFFL